MVPTIVVVLSVILLWVGFQVYLCSADDTASRVLERANRVLPNDPGGVLRQARQILEEADARRSIKGASRN